MWCWASRQVMSSGEPSNLSSNISTWGEKKEKKKRGWVLVIGKLRGASIFSTCLASPLSTALTAEHVNDPVKGGSVLLCLGWCQGAARGQPSALRGGVNRTRWGGGAGKLACFCYRLLNAPDVFFMNEMSKMFYLKLLYILITRYFNQDNCVAVMESEVLEQLCSWPKHIQAAACEADARVTHLWLIERKIYSVLLIFVINNKWELQII